MTWNFLCHHEGNACMTFFRGEFDGSFFEGYVAAQFDIRDNRKLIATAREHAVIVRGSPFVMPCLPKKFFRTGF